MGKMVMNSQLRSIKSANAKKLGGVELHAHYISRRYAEFTSSILLILNKGKKEHMAEKRMGTSDAAQKKASSVDSAPDKSPNKEVANSDSNPNPPTPRNNA